MKLKSILLIEDNDISVLLVHEYLEKYSVSITTCGCCSDCKNRINNGEIFNIVLLDLKLPGESGYELFVFIKNKLPNIPIIVCSALSMNLIKKEFESLQMFPDLILSKPISKNSLIAALQEYKIV